MRHVWRRVKQPKILLIKNYIRIEFYQQNFVKKIAIQKHDLKKDFKTEFSILLKIFNHELHDKSY